jgi:hypothetical protein
MQRLIRGLMLLVASAAFAMCGGSPAGPSPEGALRLTAQADRTVLSRGETAVITFTLRNASKDSARIDSPDACILVPFVFDRRAGKLVDDLGGGAIACAQVVTSFELAPGDIRTLEVSVRAGAGAGPFVPLPPGEYWIYARLHDDRYALQSTPVTIAVQ